jgi:hypothetical protein
MRNIILAAAAAFALIVATAPGFARPARHNSHNDHSRCAAILANPAGHQASEVEYCRFYFG